MTQNCLSRRSFLGLVGAGALSLSALRANALTSPATELLTLYVGTYTTGASEGIYIYRMNPVTGDLTHFKTVKEVVNPSFLAIAKNRRYLYAVNEVTEFEGKPGGAVSAFQINSNDGDLRFLNQEASLGGAPCHLFVDATDRSVLVANYIGGNVSVLLIDSNGALGKATDLAQHRGSSVTKERQEGPHAHCVILDASNRHAFVADLGIDRIMIYRFDEKQGKLRPGSQPWIELKPGAGPRHFKLHPNGRHAYVINELDSTVTAFNYDRRTGGLIPIESVSTLPEGYSGTNSCADLHVGPTGAFLYGSNRGHDSIVMYKIDQRTGRLQLVQHVATQGKTPRNFAIDPTGRFLLVANQGSDNVVVFRIDSKTGKLTPTGHSAEIPTPVCLVF